MLNPNKALLAIEYLTSSGFSLDMEMLLYNQKGKNKQLIECAKVITEIYKIAHCEGSCRHKDWEDIKIGIIKENI